MVEISWNEGITWSAELETGYINIDGQHRTLFKLVSDLIELCQREEKIEINKTLMFLVNYATEHFADEEYIARIYKYPQFEKHKKMHEDFTKTVGVFVEHYERNGDSEVLSSVVNKLIISWIINHIRNEDSKIAEHIKKLERR